MLRWMDEWLEKRVGRRMLLMAADWIRGSSSLSGNKLSTSVF